MDSDDPSSFRPRPTKLALGVTSGALTLIALQFATLIISVAGMSLARSATGTREWLLYSPFAASYRLVSLYPRLDSVGSYAYGELIVSAVAIALAAVAAWLWPTERSVVVQLFVHAVGVAAIITGVIAPVIARDSFLSAAAATRVPSFAIRIILGLLGLWIIMMIERKTIELLTNFYTLETPGQRLPLWAIRHVPSMLLLTAVCYLNGWGAGALGYGAALVATLIETLSHIPRQRYEKLTRVRMREEAATLPIVAAAVVVCSIWLFGARLAALPPRVVQLGGSKQFAVTPASQIKVEAKSRENEKKKKPEKIQMRWSKDRPAKPAGK